MNKQISILLKNMCCSKCKSDFDNNSVKILYKDKDYYVAHLICKNCGKDFGIIYLKLTNKKSKDKKDLILNDSRNLPPINTDDVLDAHNQIKNFEKNWNKFMKD